MLFTIYLVTIYNLRGHHSYAYALLVKFCGRGISSFNYLTPIA